MKHEHCGFEANLGYSAIFQDNVGYKVIHFLKEEQGQLKDRQEEGGRRKENEENRKKMGLYFGYFILKLKLFKN